MEDTFCPVRGDSVPPRELNIRKAKDLAVKLEDGEIDFADLIECKKDGTREVVVLDADVQVPQRRVHPIRARERIAVTFDESDRIAPEVQALRADFPLVPHLNLRPEEYPRSICLDDQRYESLKRRWTGPRFVLRIREWLALTAEGKLHQDDQPLEPLLLDHAGHIVLPHDLATDKGTTERLYVTGKMPLSGEKCFLLTQRQPPSEKACPFVAAVHRCQPQVHGIIHRLPTTLAGLADLVAPAGLDLLKEMRQHLGRWRTEGNDLLNSGPICVIVFPKTREEGGDVEADEKWAFVLDGRVRDIGVKLDVWQRQGGQLGDVLAPDPSKRGDDIRVMVLNPLSQLTRAMAALLNRRSVASEVHIAAVGAGALGSQVVMNFARSGFGTWTLIDHDLLMPHNVARHALPGCFVGWPKVQALGNMANDVCADSTAFSALQADVLSPGERQEELGAAFRGADVILDMSADVTVARQLACDVDSEGRRLSLFLTPTGKDMVLLAEDKQRRLPLDALEMQCYRAALHDSGLEGLLAPAGGRRRYGQSCRDISSTLPQNLVAMHAGIAAKVLEDVLAQPDAMIAIWRSDDGANVRRVDVRPSREVRQTVGDWTVVTDGGLLEELSGLRKEKLPNETGGVLLGSFDLERGILYIVDMLPSPPDSEEWPALYIRGFRGLRKAVETIVDKTHGMLEYVGEWHSHPEGASTAAGTDDERVFDWLAEWMDSEGLPPVMVIAGHQDRFSCFVGEIKKQKLLPGVPLHERQMA